MISVFVASLLAFFHSLPWGILFFFTQFVGVRMYILSDRDECTRIQKRVYPYCSQFTDGDKAGGYSFGQWYALYIHCDRSETCQVSMIATVDSYTRLTQSGHTVEKRVSKDPTSFTIYERLGNYNNPWFRRRNKEIQTRPTAAQHRILESIVLHYTQERKTVVLLHGPPGTGKSMMGLLLANHFKSSFCNTLKPWQPGESYGNLYMEVEPVFRKPLVTVFDEMDTTFLSIKQGIKQHDSIPTSVANKQGWNHMIDEIQRSMYPDTILLLTSNIPPADINAIDESFIRNKRVDLIFELSEEV